MEVHREKMRRKKLARSGVGAVVFAPPKPWVRTKRRAPRPIHDLVIPAPMQRVLNQSTISTVHFAQ